MYSRGGLCSKHLIKVAMFLVGSLLGLSNSIGARQFTGGVNGEHCLSGIFGL
jgi:hypothetical protein